MAKPDRAFDLLAKVDLFEDLSKKDLRQVAGITKPFEFATGDALTEEGKPAGRFHVIESGTGSDLLQAPRHTERPAARGAQDLLCRLTRSAPRPGARRPCGDASAGGAPVKTLDLAALARGAKLNARNKPLARFDGRTVHVSRFSEHPRWELHPRGDELLQVIEGELEVTVLKGAERAETVLRQGEVFIVPANVWHSPRPRGPVSLLSMADYEGTRTSNDDDPCSGLRPSEADEHVMTTDHRDAPQWSNPRQTPAWRAVRCSRRRVPGAR